MRPSKALACMHADAHAALRRTGFRQIGARQYEKDGTVATITDVPGTTRAAMARLLCLPPPPETDEDIYDNVVITYRNTTP